MVFLFSFLISSSDFSAAEFIASQLGKPNEVDVVYRQVEAKGKAFVEFSLEKYVRRVINE